MTTTETPSSASQLLSLPAAELAALLVETVGDPRDLARLEIACPAVLLALCGPPPVRGAEVIPRRVPTPGIPWLPARRYLNNSERAWLYAHGLRVRLHRTISRRRYLVFAECTSWYRNGFLHRDDDLPAMRWSDGDCYWFQDGLRHRDGGRPAEVYNLGGTRVATYWWHGRQVSRKKAMRLAAAAAKKERKDKKSGGEEDGDVQAVDASLWRC